MAKQRIDLISNVLQVDPEFTGAVDQLKFYICDTEGDLPSPAFGKFAIVREPDEAGHYYFQVGTYYGWKRTKLNQ